MSHPSYTNEPWITLSRVIETTADLVLLRLTFANPYALPLAMSWYLLHFTAMFLWTEFDKTSRNKISQSSNLDQPIDLDQKDVKEAIKAADNVDIYKYRLMFLSKQFYKDVIGGFGITGISSLVSERMMKLISSNIHPLLISSGFLLIPLMSKLYYNYVFLEDVDTKEKFIESLVNFKYLEERKIELEESQADAKDENTSDGVFSFLKRAFQSDY